MPPADRFEHGTRARYTSGCRCPGCREANRIYNRGRVGKPFNGLVDAAEARDHLVRLAEQGVGRRSVAAASDVAPNIVAAIRSGRQLRVRASTAERILNVDGGAIADAALVPAAPTWRAVRKLLAMGWTKGAVSQALGHQVPALQMGRRNVLARTALAVEKLLRRARAETPTGIDDLCTACGHSHEHANRVRLIRPMAEETAADVAAAWPCFYPDYEKGSAAEARLFRDLRATRALKAA